MVFEWILKPIHKLLSQTLYRHIMMWRETRARRQHHMKEGN